MSYRHTIEAALENLDEIRTLISTFSEKGEIPSVEIDLTLQKLRNLYEIMLMLKKPQGGAAEFVQPQLNEKESGPALKQGTEAPSSIKQEQPSESNPVSPSEQTIIDDKNDMIPEADNKSKKPVREKTEILSDQFRGKETLHETYHHTYSQKDISMPGAGQVSDIYSAIGINDRFTFIRELFDNDTALFEQTIQILNNAGSYQEAHDHIMTNFEWDADTEPVQLLIQLLKRKFTK